MGGRRDRPSTSRPIPTTAHPSWGRASIRIPATLRSSIQTSLGHLSGTAHGRDALARLARRDRRRQGEQPEHLVSLPDDDRERERAPARRHQGTSLASAAGGPCSSASTTVPAGAPPRREVPCDVVRGAGQVGMDDRDRRAGSRPAPGLSRSTVSARPRCPGLRRAPGRALSVHRDRDRFAGVLVEHRLARRSVRESPGEVSRGEACAPTRTRSASPRGEARLFHLLGGEVEPQVPETVDGDHLCPDRTRVSGCGKARVAQHHPSRLGEPASLGAPRGGAGGGANKGRPWNVAESSSSRLREMSTATSTPPVRSMASGQPICRGRRTDARRDIARARARRGSPDVGIDDREVETSRHETGSAFLSTSAPAMTWRGRGSVREIDQRSRRARSSRSLRGRRRRAWCHESNRKVIRNVGVEGARSAPWVGAGARPSMGGALALGVGGDAGLGSPSRWSPGHRHDAGCRREGCRGRRAGGSKLAGSKSS